MASEDIRGDRPKDKAPFLTSGNSGIILLPPYMAMEANGKSKESQELQPILAEGKGDFGEWMKKGRGNFTFWGFIEF